MEKKKATEGQRVRIEGMLKSGLIDFDEAQEIITKPRTEIELRLVRWDDRFPGKGRELMDVLQPFYGKRTFTPPLPDLEERAKKAIFWHEFDGIRTLRKSDARSISSGDLHFESLGKTLESLLGSPLKETLWDLLGESRSLERFRPLLFLSCGYILADLHEEADKFQPLLDLWLAGNFPYGFDKEGNLLVLVAD
jgi:hypothetical protein